jgi:hypothetical protein
MDLSETSEWRKTRFKKLINGWPYRRGECYQLETRDFGQENTPTMFRYLNSINLLLFSLAGGIAEASITTLPQPTNTAPVVLVSQPQITQAPAPVLHRDIIEGRQAISWNICSGFSIVGYSGNAASVSCEAPYTCAVGVHSVSPYWGCDILPATSVAWYTTCRPYADLDSIYYSNTRYW